MSGAVEALSARVPTPGEVTAETAAAALRGYLDAVGFVEVFKYVAAVNHYFLSPNTVHTGSRQAVRLFFDTNLAGRREDLGLVRCLMLDEPVSWGRLSELEKPVADALLAAGLLDEAGEGLEATRHQLISSHGLSLLIDKRINFPAGEIHDVYIGIDTFLMLYYVDTARIARSHRGLDLCTGTGAGALFLARHAGGAVATDIGAEPLALARLNRALNGLEDRVEVREEDLRSTLGGGERFDVVTCNPPFVAFLPELRGPLYADGGADGLDYMRLLLERLPATLTPNGVAYLVADLMGGDEGPSLLGELEDFAAGAGFGVDVFIDNRLPAEAQLDAMAGFLASLYPQEQPEEIRHRFAAMQRSLGTSHYYLSTIKARAGAARSGVRVFTRYRPPTPAAAPPWSGLFAAEP